MKKRGIGIANVIYPMDAANKSSATAVFVKINHDGSAIIYSGCTDLGQGSGTVLMQIASETLGIPIEQLRFISSDTDLTPYDEGTGASRDTYIVGSCVRLACQDALQKLLSAAAWKLNFPDTGKLYAENGRICIKSFPEKYVTIADAAWISERQHGFSPIGQASFGTLSDSGDQETGHCRNFEKHIFGTHIAQVEVDTETGIVDVLRYVAVHDCGRAINPLLLTGQIEGGISMGLGQALFEKLEEGPATGRLINNNFTDYLLPTSMDMPEQMLVDYVESYDEDGPFGALGIGEATPCPVMPALSNAVFDATGVRITQMPLTPECVLKALRESADHSSAA